MYEKEDLEEHFNQFMEDWGVVEYREKTYLIDYFY